eukprot:sb/3474229/
MTFKMPVTIVTNSVAMSTVLFEMGERNHPEPPNGCASLYYNLKINVEAVCSAVSKRHGTLSIFRMTFEMPVPIVCRVLCPGFTVDGSMQGSWNDTDSGQTVTINCQKKHVLDGSSERTCNTDGSFLIKKKLVLFMDCLPL